MRIGLQQTALSQIDSIGNTVKSAVQTQSFDLDSTGQTVTQRAAASQLDQILGALNTPAGDRYLFSGPAGEQACDRHARSHPQWRWRARRSEAGDRRAQPGRSWRQRAGAAANPCGGPVRRVTISE
ncbi:MAG: hypothetical protein WDO17_19430 [Alphaproteobacteria bacterium]